MTVLVRNAKRLRNLLSLSLTLVPIGAVGWVLWFLVEMRDRGFDVTDEGYYLLAASHPSDGKGALTFAPRLMSLLFGLMGRNVVWYRMAGVAATCAAGAILAWGLRALWSDLDAGRHRPGRIEFLSDAAVVAIAGLLAYGWFLLTPGYNAPNAWAMSTAAGCFVGGIAPRGSTRTGADFRTALMVAVGVFTALCLLVKFPTGISIIALVSLVLLVWPFERSLRLKRFGAVAVGLFLVFVAFFVLVQSPSSVVESIRNGIAYNDAIDAGQNLGALTRYWHQWRDEVLRATPAITWYLLAALAALGLIFRLVRQRWSRAAGTAAAAMGLVLAFAAYVSATHLQTIAPKMYFDDVVRFNFGWLLMAVVLGITYGIRDDRLPSPARRAQFLIGAMLLALPFAGVVGTGAAIQIIMAYDLAPWFGLIVVVLTRIAMPGDWRSVGDFVKAVLAVFGAVQIVGGAQAAPYRLNTPLRQQVVATLVGSPSTSLSLDPETHAFFDDLRAHAARCGFRPGADLLAFFDFPGVVFALGARSPGMGWYTGAYPGSRTAGAKALEMAGVERVSRAFLLETNKSREWLGGLSHLGINFPRNYEPCGTFKIPYTWSREEARLWRPLIPGS